MKHRRIFRTSNSRVRMMVGLLLLGLAGYLATHSDADADTNQYVQTVDRGHLVAESDELLAEMERLAEADHVALLEMCLRNAEGYRDYAGTFIKQERIEGALRDEQIIDFRHRDAPFSVAMAWRKNAPRGDRILYIHGRNDNQMLVRVNESIPFLGGMVVTRDPEGKEVMQNTLNPVTRFGFRRGLENLIGVYRSAREAGDLRIEFGGYSDVQGSKCLRLVRHLPLKGDYPAKRTEIHLDVASLLPVCIKSYNGRDELVSKYIYRDLQFNLGLDDDSFTKSSNDM